MEKFILNNGLEIPEIGFGTFPQKETLPESALTAYRAGYRLFDISDNYHNEEYLGEAVRSTENKMDDAVIISKFSQPYRTGEFDRCFEESVTKLAGRLDIYLLHWPYPFLWKEQWRRMEQLYLGGKCRGIGVCNFEVDKLKELLSFCKVKPVINQIERHPLFQQNDIVEFCKANDIQVICYSPTARQDSELFDSKVLKDLAAKYSKSAGQIIFRWAVQTGTVPIPGSRSADHIKDNYDIGGFCLTEEEIELISGLECGKRIRFDPKTRFTGKEKFRYLKKRIRILAGV